MSWSIEWYERPTLRKPVLVEGLPGVGNVAKLATDFMVEQLKARKCCSFFSHQMPHSVFVNENNLIELPTIDLYYKRLPGHQHDLLLLAGDTQPLDEPSCYQFSDTVLGVLKDLKASEIITLGGIAMKNIPKDPKVFCTGNSEKSVSKYKKMGISNNLYGIVGPIIGVSGVLTGMASKYNFSAVSLLAETYGHPMYIGVPGATVLLEIIKKKLDLRLNVSRLSKGFAEIEAEWAKKDVPQQPRNFTSYIG